MNHIEYVSLHEYIQGTTGVAFNTVDKLLSKLACEDLITMREVLVAFYEAGEEGTSFKEKYEEGYAEGWEDAKDLYETS